MQAGRTISPVAYAWYARALHHEKRGDLRRAERDYRAVLDHDEKSGAAWAALGRVLCQSDEAQALKEFDKGLKRAKRVAPIYLERGRCRLKPLLRHSNASPNLLAEIQTICEESEVALREEPHNPRASGFLVQCYRAAGDQEQARRYERGARLYLDPEAVQPQATSTDAIDQALWRGDLETARQLALTEITPGELAARALGWGKKELALEQAQLVYQAAPQDADALIVLLCLGMAEVSLDQAFGEPSDVAVVLLAAQLRRASGLQSAEHFLQQSRDNLDASEDPLVRSLLSRE